jgi:CheY-like chemotaxis protein
MNTILLIDDDIYSTRLYIKALEMSLFEVTAVDSVEVGLAAIKHKRFDVVVLDIMMPHGMSFDSISTLGGFETGTRLIKPIAALSPSTKIVVLTNTIEPEAQLLVKNIGGAYFQKQRTPPYLFAKEIRAFVDGRVAKVKAFIIHGHDRALLLELKNYLQNRLNFEEPIVLSEQASGTRTIIEKFEDYAQQVDCAFALLSPDDFNGKDPARARQNVIFELGYFIGAFGRRSSRVFVLKKGALEIPSDLLGVIYIDVTKGIESAGEMIRKETASLRMH